MLTVFNVGQGDAMLLKPDSGCVFGGDNAPLLIDAGRRGAKVHERITDPTVDVLVTHAHGDHVGGVPALIKRKKVGLLLMPYYMPEVVSICGFLHRHATTKIARLNWDAIRGAGLRLVGEGDRLVGSGGEICRHSVVLNPPKSPRSHFEGYMPSDVPETVEEVDRALRSLSRYDMRVEHEAIVNYETPISVESVSEEAPEYASDARAFVHRFFLSLSHRMDGAPPGSLPYYLDAHLALAAHTACVVFKYTDKGGERWLFTGDADKSVFDRLIEQGSDVSAKHLKVPHHGSRSNLTPQALGAVDPEVAIISHDNGRFGDSKDTHPHAEVIEMLDKRRVRTHYTNDVRKGKRTIKRRSSGTHGPITFE